MELLPSPWAIAPALFLCLLAYVLQRAIWNIYGSPLAKFPGPKLAAATSIWRFYYDCVHSEPFYEVLRKLHQRYGNVVRVGPHELHFGNPEAYPAIYNSQNRWDKEPQLYHSFGEDRSSFGFLTYKESKERKDVLNKLFSPKAVAQVEGIVVEKIQALCDVFTKYAARGELVNLNLAYRCMTVDIITFLAWGESIDAIHTPDFKAPIITAMDASLPVFARFKHIEWYKNMIMNCPPNLSRILSPPTAGLVDLQVLLKARIADITTNPDHLDRLPHQMTIYHHLLDKEAYRSGTAPSSGSLYEECQALMFAGTDTTGTALMMGTYYLLRKPDAKKKLVDELKNYWTSLERKPTGRELESLPYLNAVIKESLRVSSGVISGLLRIVPPKGADICGTQVPENTVVSCGSTFVHYNADLFPNPNEFEPERWIKDPGLDQWLVAFSKGPRACLGVNLAWLELRLSFAYFFRLFDMTLDPSSPSSLHFMEGFLPYFDGPPVKVRVSGVKA